MVVIVVVSFMVGGAIFIVGGKDPAKDLDGSIEKFTAYAQLMSDLSLVTGEPVGLIIQPPTWRSMEVPAWGYQWKRFVQGEDASGDIVAGWMEIESVEIIDFPSELDLYIELEGEEWDWEDNEPIDLPIFVFHPSGETEPLGFQISFTHEAVFDEPQTVEVSPTGIFIWLEKYQAEQERLEWEANN